MRDKSELYGKQQHEMIQKMIDILQLDSEASITLWHLDRDIKKQKKLMELIPEIRKWFASCNIRGVSDPHLVKRPWLSMIKQIIGKEYDIINVDFRIYTEKPTVRTKKYTFLRKEEIQEAKCPDVISRLR